MSRCARFVCLCVFLVGLAIRPISAQDGALVQPFQRTLTAQAVSGPLQQSASLNVPRGKRLVIEYVSVRVVTPQGGSVQAVNEVAFTTTVQGSTVKHSLAMPKRNGDFYFYPGDTFSLGQQLRLYGDGGTPITASIEFMMMGDPATYRIDTTIEWTVSGYLVG
jgi:hypothetical protein